MSNSTQERRALPEQVRDSEYQVHVHCMTCTDPSDVLDLAVEARSAVEALYKAAAEVSPQTETAYEPPSGRMKTYEDWCDGWTYAHEYSVEVSCDYGSDIIDGIGGEALSPARALYDAAVFDDCMREHRATEW